MNRRTMISTVGVSTAGLAVAGATARAAQDPAHGKEAGHYATMTECARACGHTVVHCMNQLKEGSGAREGHARMVELAASCKEFCLLAASLTACHSPMVHLAHEATAEACRMCAEGCERHEDKAEVLAHCAKACRACAEACKNAARASRQ